MVLRMLANVLLRQSVSFAISWSIRPMNSWDLYASNSRPDALTLARNGHAGSGSLQSC
jgi:hypothetical protein